MTLSRRSFLGGMGAGIATSVLPGFAAAPANAATDFRSFTINSKPLTHFNLADASQDQFGPLRFLGGLQLWARQRQFGGISGGVVSQDGTHFTTVTDGGYWIRFNLRQNRLGRPLSVSDGVIAPMLDERGAPLPGSAKSDVEALTLDRSTSPPRLIASYEGRGGLFAYPAKERDLPPQATKLQVPEAVHKLGGNKGLEALAAGLPDTPHAGKLIAIAERGRSLTDHRTGFILGAGKPASFSVLRDGNFDVTDAAFLPSGDLLILERLFNLREGLQMRLRLVPANELQPGANIKGRMLYTADFSHQIDNMEVATVHTRPDKTAILTLMSDDNRSLLQRTLLLRFEVTL
ncbi:esterase-like activity of phytase family protein [Pseudovibrio exalbescens]|uniref:esterase-like activity of phytase family protein n=1 Tax=Pseudovibrio exalbescens TaxID=197461 RepID=UPI000C9CFC06|nr:esterase-like activity of phytase family protein [Pseudovibrio exalbescens]